MNTTKVGKRLYIADGPNLDRIFDVLKYSDEIGVHLSVDFKIYDDESCEHEIDTGNYRISGLDWRGKGGGKIIFRGQCRCHFPGWGSKVMRFKAFYDSRCRKGNITFFELESRKPRQE